jgi:hypothetical protein
MNPPIITEIKMKPKKKPKKKVKKKLILVEEYKPKINKINISDIISNENLLYDYIQKLNHYTKTKTIREILNFARSICHGLPSEEELNPLQKSDKCIKDKGLFGKIIEYGLFGQKPNSDSTPDLIKLGYDIKSCAFKNVHDNTGKNAKERQTLTNCGNTKNYDSFKNICDNENFADCKYFQKSSKFILFVRNDDKVMLKTYDQLLNQSILLIIYFNINKIPIEMTEIINADYENIRQSIFEKRVSQKGQTYLHIHPHGMGHGSETRALGYTSKFITQVVALQLSEIYKKKIDDILITKGRSVAIKKEYL